MSRERVQSAEDSLVGIESGVMRVVDVLERLEDNKNRRIENLLDTLVSIRASCGDSTKLERAIVQDCYEAILKDEALR